MTTKKTKKLSLAELQAQLAEYGMKAAPDEASLKKKAQEMRAVWVKMAEDAGMTAGSVWHSNANGQGLKKIRYKWGDGDKEKWTGVGEPPSGLKAKMDITRNAWLALPKEERLVRLAPYKTN